MLVLTRRPGERMMIGNEVSIEVVSIRGNQVRFGINAPKATLVHREEVYRRIQAERQVAG